MDSAFSRSLRKVFSGAVLIILLGPSAYAEINVDGYVNSYHAVRSHSPYVYLSSRTTLRTELNGYQDWGEWFTSINIEDNSFAEKNVLALREAYIRYCSDNYSLNMGRQLIIWGKADGLQITDIVSPRDLTEFLARDYDEIRVPVDAVELEITKGSYGLELVFLPSFQPSILPTADSPWSVMGENSNLIVSDPLPEKTFTNGEYGCRFSAYASGIDYAFSFFRHYNDLPFYTYQNVINNEGNGSLEAFSHRYLATMVGVDLSKPISSIVVRYEAAYNDRNYFALENDIANLAKKPVVKQLIGLDWYPGGEWTVITQFSNTTILDYSRIMQQDENSSLVTLNVSKKLFHTTLTLSSFSYIDLNNSGLFCRNYLEYSLSDEIKLSAGYDLFHGDEGQFAVYKDNSEVWIKARYSFQTLTP